jgi:murein L,D-transpeptidase YcbB/YkuD
MLRIHARVTALMILPLLLLSTWTANTWSEEAEGSSEVDVAGAIARLLATDQDSELQAFYSLREQRPAWQDGQAVAALATALHTLDADGLVPRDYRPDALIEAYRLAYMAANPEERARFDLEASRTLLTALRHLQRGKVNPAAIDPEWELPQAAPQLDLAAVSRAVDEQQFESAFAAARPAHALYAQLRAGLARYRTLEQQGGWPMLPAQATSLRPGDRHDDVPLLRQRLALIEELPTPALDGCGDPGAAAATPDPRCYDEILAAAVRRFQHRHLLTADGVVAAKTRAALNVPVAERIDQIRVNLERARWLLHDLPESFVLVDIAGYQLSYFRPDGEIWRARIVDGRPTRQTPILRSAITYLTFNPTWTIPPTILREDVLPKVRKDPGYLARENITVLSPSGTRLDPLGIDWSHPGNLILRQDSGPHNSLGRVAIRFANRHQVYLHDTPAQALFSLDQRAISSGCMRVENALEFAHLLLDDEIQWNRAAIAEAIAEGRTRDVHLAQPVPLILSYWTVHADADGTLTFRPDIYQRDPVLLAALNQPLAL